MPISAQKMKDKYNKIAAALAKEYGYPEWRQHIPPVDELVNTDLSAKDF